MYLSQVDTYQEEPTTRLLRGTLGNNSGKPEPITHFGKRVLTSTDVLHIRGLDELEILPYQRRGLTLLRRHKVLARQPIWNIIRKADPANAFRVYTRGSSHHKSSVM